MKKLKVKVIVLILFFNLFFSGLAIGNFNCNDTVQKNNNFYFVHITDTHVMHRLFDRDESTQKTFKSAIETAISFDEKPAFIVITGDLCEWGGSGISGALNCQAFVNCLYKNGATKANTGNNKISAMVHCFNKKAAPTNKTELANQYKK